MRNGLGWTTVPCVVVALTAAACAPATTEMPVGVQPAPDAATAATAFGTTGLAYEGTVASARLALQRTQDPNVRAYAQRIITAYEPIPGRFRDVAVRHGITPVPGTAGQRMEEAQRRTADVLGQYEGVAFDRTWLDFHIAQQRWLLGAIDRSYLPAATGRPDLETELRTMRTTLQRDLEEAERLRRELPHH